jgi:hypothetical protein
MEPNSFSSIYRCRFAPFSKHNSWESSVSLEFEMPRLTFQGLKTIVEKVSSGQHREVQANLGRTLLATKVLELTV